MFYLHDLLYFNWHFLFKKLHKMYYYYFEYCYILWVNTKYSTCFCVIFDSLIICTFFLFSTWVHKSYFYTQAYEMGSQNLLICWLQFSVLVLYNFIRVFSQKTQRSNQARVNETNPLKRPDVASLTKKGLHMNRTQPSKRSVKSSC